jgi:hypothetical protein
METREKPQIFSYHKENTKKQIDRILDANDTFFAVEVYRQLLYANQEIQKQKVQETIRIRG